MHVNAHFCLWWEITQTLYVKIQFDGAVFATSLLLVYHESNATHLVWTSISSFLLFSSFIYSLFAFSFTLWNVAISGNMNLFPSKVLIRYHFNVCFYVLCLLLLSSFDCLSFHLVLIGQFCWWRLISMRYTFRPVPRCVQPVSHLIFHIWIVSTIKNWFLPVKPVLFTYFHIIAS